MAKGPKKKHSHSKQAIIRDERRSDSEMRSGAVLYVYVKASVSPSDEVHRRLACGAVAGHSPFTFRNKTRHWIGSPGCGWSPVS
jgi:hypothetical protein